jgi:hypothetical protein
MERSGGSTASATAFAMLCLKAGRPEALALVVLGILASGWDAFVRSPISPFERLVWVSVDIAGELSGNWAYAVKRLLLGTHDGRRVQARAAGPTDLDAILPLLPDARFFETPPPR